MKERILGILIYFREAFYTLKKQNFFSLLMLISVLLFVSSLLSYYFELSSSGDIFKGFWDAVWWSFVTLTTVGYGDIVPKTLGGRLVGIGIMISGIALLSLITATISSVFVERRIREGKGLEAVREKGHIVICGWNQNATAVIDGILAQGVHKAPVLVLVNELPLDEIEEIQYRYKDYEIKYVSGHFTRENVLARANIKKATAAVILADTSGENTRDSADERTIFATLAIKSMAPHVKTFAELLNPENREHLIRANVDEVFVRGELTGPLLANAVISPGVSRVIKDLITFRAGFVFKQIPVPNFLRGRRCAEFIEWLRIEKDAILVAIISEIEPLKLEDILSEDYTAIDEFIKRQFEKSDKEFFSSDKKRMSVSINPGRDYMLQANDSGVIIVKEKA